MPLARQILLSSLLAVPLLAGCCCPEISGRYSDLGMPPPAALDDGYTHCGGGSLHGDAPLLARRRGGHGPFGTEGSGWRAPSQQQDDYVSPLPKFHPVPTRPVFEPLPVYQPAAPLDLSHAPWSAH